MGTAGTRPDEIVDAEIGADEPFSDGSAPSATPLASPSGRSGRRERRRVEDANRVGSALNVLTHHGLHIMHDRSVPGTDGVIEHIVIGNNGLTVVRSARLSGRIRSTKTDLYIGGNNVTVLVTGLKSRVDTVRYLVGGEAVVQGAFALMRRRSDRIHFHGPIALGSPQALVDYLEHAHLAAAPVSGLADLAEELEGILLPKTLRS